MKSLVLTNQGLKLADTPIPSLLPGEVRIEVRAVGIGRTDLDIWRGELEAPLPLILGHEISGFIHESTDPHLPPGTPVTTEIDLSCGRCHYCKTGLRHHCKNRRTLGMTTDGGMAEYLCVPAELVHPLPEGVDSITGAFAEPVASAVATIKAVPAERDEIVAVVGDGATGIMIAQVYDAAGAEPYLIGNNQWKLGLARQLGLRHIINCESDGWKNRISDVTEEIGPRVVIEATGTPKGLQTSLDIVRSGGTIVINGFKGINGDIPPAEIFRRELRIVGTRRTSYTEALDMLAKGRIEVKRLVNKRFSIEEGTDAFEYASQPKTTKVLIQI